MLLPAFTGAAASNQPDLRRGATGLSLAGLPAALGVLGETKFNAASRHGHYLTWYLGLD